MGQGDKKMKNFCHKTLSKAFQPANKEHSTSVPSNRSVLCSHQELLKFQDRQGGGKQNICGEKSQQIPRAKVSFVLKS